MPPACIRCYTKSKKVREFWIEVEIGIEIQINIDFDDDLDFDFDKWVNLSDLLVFDVTTTELSFFASGFTQEGIDG